ncbi:TMV resistance protein N-like [Senna tora]|uniref:TMV resistance protein N-like n=1 Tax=Senna tora TaxID=362788 RepID=A0A834SU60_9FABA|nr:TMV resistance protein N-like [Senna tora]
MRLHGTWFRRNMAEATCDVFLNHRRVDTKRTVVRLLYHHLVKQGVKPFLDTHNMKPGDRLFDNIEKGVLGCKVGVAVFSPRYCDSYFCLHELSLMVESRKRIVPIFYDVKPSQLRVKDNNGWCSELELSRFSLAIEEAKYIVGLSYDSSKGDWSKLVLKASEAIVANLNELEKEKSV